MIVRFAASHTVVSVYSKDDFRSKGLKILEKLQGGRDSYLGLV